MVTGWTAPGRAEVTGPQGLLEVHARAVVLATGARERPRAARLVPGTRPAGVFTTGQLQQWVHREHLPVGRRALVVGAEHVSYSAVLTLREAGVHPVALVTDLPATQTYRPFDVVTRAGLQGSGLDADVGRRHLRKGTGGRGCCSAGRAATNAPWPSTPSCSAATSCPTTSWPARPASRSTRAPAVRPVTPTAAPRPTGSSRRATSCIRPRRRTSRRGAR